ncbi:protein kinase domain-containing protein [Estrella lausannensis]|uniref:Protein tyrosine kinase n=1 Tax=Estrella lausannensis TaxID=483423 RepID=A0A0H5E4N0_9BACT|nr:hypothetical protein [Estrella lausannensis]CRX38190.1 Protein tyrosine kinase [Estrella lausannensis]
MNINTAYGLIQSFAKEMELPKNRVNQDAKPSLDKIASIVNDCMQAHAITADQKAELVNCLASITNLGNGLSSNQFIAKNLVNKAQNVLKIAQALEASKLESPLSLSPKKPMQHAESKQQSNISPPASDKAKSRSHGASKASDRVAAKRSVIKPEPEVSPPISDKSKSRSHGVSNASRKVFSRRAIVKPEPKVSPPVSEKATSHSPVASKASSKGASKPEEMSSPPRVEVVKQASAESISKKGVKALSGKGAGHASEKQKTLTKALAELLDTPRLERKIGEKLANSLKDWASDNKGAREPNLKELARVLDEIHQKVEPDTLRSMQGLKTNLKTAIDALRDVEAERVRATPPDQPKKADVNPLLEKSKSIEAKLSKNKSRLQLKKIKKSGSFVQKELHRHETVGVGGGGEVVSYKSQSHNTKKAVKILHDAESSSNESELKSLYINPITGKEVKSIPGLQPQAKITAEEGTVKVFTLFESDITNLEREISYNDLMKGVADLAFGLAHMHRDMGDAKPAFVHRDMKPENILFGKSKGQLQFCICDFDSAHLADGEVHSNVLDSPKYLTEDEKLIKQLLEKGDTQPLTMHAKAHINDFYRSLDVRNMGLVFITLIAGRSPESIEEEITLDDVAPNIKMDANADEVKLQQLCELVSQMTEPWWDKRPSMEQVLERMQQIGIELPDYQHIS